MVPWPPPNAPHRRKFLQVLGRRCSQDGKAGPLESLNVWCEYEGPTVALRLAHAAPGSPLHLHQIHVPPGAPQLNTDPWIFYPGFVWTICRHGALVAPVRPGTVVLFGSSSAEGWFLDTVFVILRRVQQGAPELGGAYSALVEPTVSNTEPFLGATPWASPFSFVPAAPASHHHSQFSRPDVSSLFRQLRRVSNGQAPSPRNAQALVRCTGPSSFWQDIASMVCSRGLVLGCDFAHPFAAQTGTLDRGPTSRCS